MRRFPYLFKEQARRRENNHRLHQETPSQEKTKAGDRGHGLVIVLDVEGFLLIRNL